MTTYTVTSPDGIQTHSGNNKRAAIQAARGLSAKHAIGGKTIVAAGEQRVAVYIRETTDRVVALTP